jgi:hypothetical protein
MKIATTLVGSVLVAQYVEPLVAMPAPKRFVDDRGDYLIVRIPNGECVHDEEFKKPILLILEGPYALFSSCLVTGFANVLAPNGGSIHDCYFDGIAMRTKKPRAVVHVETSGGGMQFHSCRVVGNEFNSSAFEMQGPVEASSNYFKSGLTA